MNKKMEFNYMLVYVRIDDFVFFSDILLINASGRGKEYMTIPYELSPCVEIYYCTIALYTIVFYLS